MNWFYEWMSSHSEFFSGKVYTNGNLLEQCGKRIKLVYFRENTIYVVSSKLISSITLKNDV